MTTAARTADAVMGELLGYVRRRFFANETPKRWAQEQDFVKQAISFPARYLDDRGASLPADRYEKLVLRIFRDIERHMQDKAKIGRMSVFLLTCVQRHMNHHGAEYCELAKAPRTAGVLTKETMAGLKPSQVDVVTVALAQVNATLAGRTQRRCKPAAETQQELFKAAAGVKKRP